MIGRVIWIALILGAAAVTSYAQLDRQARYSPALAANVPDAFRAFAQTHVTVSALQGKNPEAALQEAKRLVERRPVPAEHLRLLALAHYEAGTPNQAAVAIQLAAKRGWRDLPAQEAMLRLALEAGDGAEAARRYAAILQNNAGSNDVLIDLGEQVFSGDEENAEAARLTMTTLLASGARWQSRFIDRGARSLPPDAFVEILGEALKRGASMDCARLGRAADAIENSDGDASTTLRQLASENC